MVNSRIGSTSVILLMFSPLAAADLHLTVTTPGRAPQTLADVPASIEVVIPGQLKELPGTTLDEKLAALIPGLSTTRSAGDITNRTAALTMRGLGSSPQGGQSQGRTLILLDGVPLNNAATGGVNWNDLTVEEIDRVEVFKGPSSSLYGSNAIGGTINIITKAASNGRSLETAYGTYNTFDTTARAGVRTGALSLELFGKHLESDGYVQAIKANRTQYTRKSSVNENTFGAKAAYDFKSMGTVRADLSRSAGVTSLGTDYQNTAKGEYLESGTGLARLS
jgi:iron complex outermembrane receptor protein